MLSKSARIRRNITDYVVVTNKTLKKKLYVNKIKKEISQDPI